MEELLKAMGMFHAQVKEGATLSAVTEASDKMREINSGVQKDTEKRASLDGLSRELALHLTGIGTDATQIQQAFQAVQPKQFGSVEQMQLEGEMSGNKNMLSISESVLNKREARKGRDLALQNKYALELEHKKGMMDIYKEMVKSGMKPKDIKPEDVTFQTNIKMGNQFIDNMEEVINRSGTWESGLPLISNKEDRAILEGAPYQLAITYAKIVDPASVAREGEVAAAQKYLVDFGPLSSKAKVKAQLNNMRTTIDQYQKSRGEAQGSKGSAASSFSMIETEKVNGQVYQVRINPVTGKKQYKAMGK